MPIDFSPARWQRVRETYNRWWDGTLDRPLIFAHSRDRAPGRPEPAAPLLTQKTCTDLTIPAEALIDRIDYELSRVTWHADSYPVFGMDCFGPGLAAAFMGARLDNSAGSVWFHPPEGLADAPIESIHLRFDPENVWFRRVCDIYRAALERWQGQVMMSMVDLGGPLDICSTFRPGERLLMDLYDSPDEVRRLAGEAHTAWGQYYRALQEVLWPMQPGGNPGYTDWAHLYSERPGYMLQCDFSYMIGPEMFREFALPELAAGCEELERPFYHLDGPGQLPHLDALLALPKLRGIQWVPGDGNPRCDQWPEVYRSITAAGKNIFIFENDLGQLRRVIGQINEPGADDQPSAMETSQKRGRANTRHGGHIFYRQWQPMDAAEQAKLAAFGVE